MPVKASTAYWVRRGSQAIFKIRSTWACVGPPRGSSFGRSNFISARGFSLMYFRCLAHSRAS